MRKLRVGIYSGIVSIAAAVVFMLPGAAAHARSGQALSISPPLLELSADPGQTVNAKIKLTNISSGALNIKTETNDFAAKGETGTPNIIFGNDAANTFSLRKWIVAPQPFQIGSKQTKTMQIPIQVPKNGEPGGHYAVIRFTGSPATNQTNSVGLNASLGTLVMLKVSGNIQEKLSVADFYSAKPTFAKASFFEKGPVNFVERLQNNGNIHLKPTGTVEVSNMLGKKTTMQLNGNPKDAKNPPRNVLPRSIRRFSQTLDTKWMFGKYTAKLHLSYGQSNKQLVATTSFWVIPYKLIVAVLIALAALIYLLHFAFKKHDQHLVEEIHREEEEHHHDEPPKPPKSE